LRFIAKFSYSITVLRTGPGCLGGVEPGPLGGHESTVFPSVAEPHHFYAAQAPGKNFDAAPAPAAPAPTLLYSKAKFLK
jgi:hypothetical protein